MSWCRRSHLSMVTFRNVSLMGSKYLARNSVVSSPISGKFSNEWNMGFCGSSLISSRFMHLGGRLSQALNNVPFRARKRSYKLPNFKPKRSKKWFENPRIIAHILLFGSGMAIYLCHLEPILYTNRTHFVLLSMENEKLWGESILKYHKQKQLEGKILAADHPESVRVNTIAKNMVESLQKVILQGDPDFDSYDQFKMGTKRVKTSRKKGKAQPDTEILERFDWEVVILDTPSSAMAKIYPGGKLIVSNGFLQHFESDAEIAAFIGHLIGHMVARHWTEQMVNELCKAFFSPILYCFVILDEFAKMPILNTKPYSKVMEAEANYIGLMLMASAGYDPSTTISKSEKLANLIHNPVCNVIASFDPQAHAMKKAMNLYQAKMSVRIEGQGEGFF